MDHAVGLPALNGCFIDGIFFVANHLIGVFLIITVIGYFIKGGNAAFRFLLSWAVIYLVVKGISFGIKKLRAKKV